jgi:ubiquinone/menaquinone biosynthesis C-methylase UbiE
MNITHPLDFSENTFDLVNGRLLVGVLLKTAWPQVLRECYRITRPGGVLRLTELDTGGITTSVAFNRLNMLASRAVWGAYGFSSDGDNLCLTPMLSPLLQQAGYQNIHQKPHAIDFSAGTDVFMDLYRNYEVLFQLLKPTLISTGVTTEEEFDPLFQQMCREMLSDDFRAIWYFLTAWGYKPA